VDKSRYSIVITINNKDMAKVATKTKVVSKSAKGKGKVVKKTAKPATKKAVAKKPAVKRAPKMVDPNKYGKFTILDAFTEKYPEMVIIDKAPAAYSSLVGKKYVSRERFITFIESEKAEAAIDKGAKSVLKEMDAAGIVPLDVENI
jgi:hypothetical protein